MVRFPQLFSKFIMGIIASLILIIHEAAARDFSVCDERWNYAAGKLVGYSDEQVAAMAGRRIISLPAFNSAHDSRTLDEVIGRDYLMKAQKNSAVLVYAADATHMCAFIFKTDTTRPSTFLYTRRPYEAGRLTALMKELATTLNLQSLWAARSGKIVAKEAASPQKKRSDTDILRDISEELFWPDMRVGLEGINHLSIIPIKEISSVPISALEPFGDGRKVVDLFSVNILAFLADVKNGPVPWPRSFERSIIVGNPRPSLDNEYQWIPLPGAEAEATQVKGTMGGKLFLREQATRSNILQSVADADLLYFAAHGFSDNINSLDGSFIVLADGRLTAREVQALKLPKRPIVVLSACQTGEGQVMEAGIVGIARAFQIAWASNTIMSLWAVDDKATAVLMTAFADRLKEAPPAEALRLAMISARKSYPSSRYWAAFNVFGNSGSPRRQ